MDHKHQPTEKSMDDYLVKGERLHSQAISAALVRMIKRVRTETRKPGGTFANGGPAQCGLKS